MILLFMFQESRSYLFKVWSTTFFLYLFEAFPYSSHILSIIFNNSNSFLVLSYQLSEPILHQGLSIRSFVLLLHLAFTLEKMSTSTLLQISSSRTNFLTKFFCLALILCLEFQYLLLIGSKSFLFLLNFFLFSSNKCI
jgi:hypothetical protein